MNDIEAFTNKEDFSDCEYLQEGELLEGEFQNLTSKPVVHDVHIKCNLNCTLDLYNIAQLTRNAEYCPQRIQYLKLEISNPSAIAQIFKIGTMNVIGTKTVSDAVLAAKKFGRVLKKLKYNVHLTDIKVTNILANSCYNFKVNFNSILNDLDYKMNIKYNPENFSGLIVKIPNLPVTSTIYTSGRILFSGAKEMKDLESASEYILKMLQLHEQKSEISLMNFQSQPKSEILIDKNKNSLKAEIKDKMDYDPFYGKKPRS
ncbi:hypothetical protein M9Y10_010275 [Tritrichomonas musculus]|uniref:TATA-box-binding protein n=1 Tax=Tritrichomonas musculus TaxID=1915356 RepID=A0ABR2ILK9_9EUKA